MQLVDYDTFRGHVRADRPTFDEMVEDMGPQKRSTLS